MHIILYLNIILVHFSAHIFQFARGKQLKVCMRKDTIYAVERFCLYCFAVVRTCPGFRLYYFVRNVFTLIFYLLANKYRLDIVWKRNVACSVVQCIVTVQSDFLGEPSGKHINFKYSNGIRNRRANLTKYNTGGPDLSLSTPNEHNKLQKKKKIIHET